MNLGCHMAQLCCPSLSALPDLSPKQKGFAERKDTVLPSGRIYLQVCISAESWSAAGSAPRVSLLDMHAAHCALP